MRVDQEPSFSNGDRAIVLGAIPGSRNIGDAISNRLLASGWSVTAEDCAIGDGSRPPGGNIPNAETAEKHGYSPTEKGVYRRFDAPAVQTFEAGNYDACIVTLGATYKDPFWDVRESDIEKVIRACLTLPLLCARRYVEACERLDGMNGTELKIPVDRKRKIVFIGSYAHRHPFTNGTAYCAAKAGLDMAARTLGWELTDRGYRIHIIHPYHVQGTPMWGQVERDVMKSKGMTYEEADAYNRKDLKMPDLLTAPEIAEVVFSLLSEPGMDWLSGTSIELYGGSR